MLKVNQKDNVMEILLILGVGSFIAYIIISTIRVWKFNKANAQISPCSQNKVNDDYRTSPLYSFLGCNIWNKRL